MKWGEEGLGFLCLQKESSKSWDLDHFAWSNPDEGHIVWGWDQEKSASRLAATYCNQGSLFASLSLSVPFAVNF